MARPTAQFSGQLSEPPSGRPVEPPAGQARRPGPSSSAPAGQAAEPPPERSSERPAEPPARRFFANWPVWLARLFSLYCRLVPFRQKGYPFDEDGPCIFIVWHGDELSLLPRFGFSRGNIMVSRSKDGDMLAAVVGHWGYPVSRGSSHRGAVAAILALKRALAAGQNIILAVDGPRGPRREAKAGAFWLAAKTGRPVYPLSAAISRAYVFSKSWSHSRLPLPFARVAACFGTPLRPGPADLALTPQEQGARLDAAMAQAEAAAQELLRSWPPKA
ncbi:MAG: DUF374 domain-containing protein [Deltaproteobacteria bacterium]|nr:DUF374 domain-containing protein [Deltaproteobacteria bacterium]